MNQIDGAMVSMIILSVVDHGFEPCLSQTKNYKIGICCFTAKYAASRSKMRDWLAQNQDNVFDCLPKNCCFSELHVAL